MNGPARRGWNRAMERSSGFRTGKAARADTADEGQRGRGAAPPLAVGDYVVTLEIGGATLGKPAQVPGRIE